MKTSLSIQYAQTQLGIVSLRKHQIEPIQSILNGHDTMVIAPTSAGKSAIYQLPALIKAEERQWTLVIEPTLSLISDQVQKLQGKGINAAYVTSRNKEEHCAIYRRLNLNTISILYTTPEQVATVAFQLATWYNKPWLVVIDEAHCVLDWGTTFRPAYLELKESIAWMALPDHHPVIAAFTATAPPDHRREIAKLLGMKKPNHFVMSLYRKNITLLKEDCSGLKVKQRLKRMRHFIRKYGQEGRVVVYCSSRKCTDLVANYLSEMFPHEVVKCHAYMEPDERERHELRFIRGDKRIMVATTAFGMGVDVPDIRLVLHFNLPLNVIDYYQQIGRAGRDENSAHAVLLYAKEDIDLNRHILDHGGYGPKLEKWMHRRLDEMANIAASDSCMVRQVLCALGEESSTNCNRCTNCQQARRCSHED